MCGPPTSADYTLSYVHPSSLPTINPPYIYSVSMQGPHQRFLLRELLRDYNPMERPVANDSQTLTVQFSFTLMQVMDVVCILTFSSLS